MPKYKEPENTERFNARIPKHTADQIERLANERGLTKTQVLIVAIDRMYRQEFTDESGDPPKA